MSIQKFLNNITSAVNKMQDYAQNEIEGEKTTIMHSEVYPTVGEAKRAAADPNFRSFYSSKKEFKRRIRGI
jgi:hypothetical protein